MRFLPMLLALLTSAALAGDPPEPGTDAFAAALNRGRVMRVGEQLVATRPGAWLLHQVGNSPTFLGYDANGIGGRFIIGTQRIRFVAWMDDMGEWREAFSTPRGEILRADATPGRSRLLVLQTDRGALTIQLSREGSSMADSAAAEEFARLLDPAGGAR